MLTKQEIEDLIRHLEHHHWDEGRRIENEHLAARVLKDMLIIIEDINEFFDELNRDE